MTASLVRFREELGARPVLAALRRVAARHQTGGGQTILPVAPEPATSLAALQAYPARPVVGAGE